MKKVMKLLAFIFEQPSYLYGNKILKKTSQTYPNDSRSGTLSVGPNSVNGSPFGAMSQWWCVYGSICLQNKTVQKAYSYWHSTGSLGNWFWLINTSLKSLVSVMACLWYQSLQNKTDRNLNLVTFHQEPCQLVLIWLMTLPSEPCHSGGVLKKND